MRRGHDLAGEGGHAGVVPGRELQIGVQGRGGGSDEAGSWASMLGESDVSDEMTV